jgi:iron complex outermembrane receptor protein
MKPTTSFNKTLMATAIAGGLAASGVPTVLAQGNVLEEIVVTAQKREENLQDVGISVSAWSGDQLRALGVKESFDVALITPGVHTGGALAGQNSQFTIRGVVQNDFNDIVEAPNAVYIDEGYVANSNAQTFATLDIERVEILKGPQGTLFGRNATGGLVQYITRKPSYEQAEGFIDIEYGQYDEPDDKYRDSQGNIQKADVSTANSTRVEAAFGGPLTDNFAGRVAVLYNERDPYLYNIYPENSFGLGSIDASDSNAPGAGAGADMGDDESKAARGTLLWQATDALEFMLSVSWAETDVATGPYQSVPTKPIFNSIGEHVNTIETATDAFGYRDPDGDDNLTSGDFAFRNHGNTETTSVNFQIDWDIGDNMQFKSITYYQEYEKLLFIDVDSAPANLAANYAVADTDTITQEFRLHGEGDGVRWTAGFYYLNIDAFSQNGLKFPENSIATTDSPLGFGVPYDLGVDANLDTESYSLFGQAEFDLTDALTLVGGFRWILEEKDFDALESIYLSTSSRSVHDGNPAFSLRPGYSDDSSDNLWTAKLQLDWRPTDDLLVYAGVNRGVKAGSFNAALPDAVKGPLPLEFVPYDEEVLTSFEVGFKSDLWGGHTRLNGSMYYYDYEDYQAFLFVSVGGYVINVDAETTGIELELQSSPIDGLDLLLSAAYFDSEIKDLPLQAGSSTLIDVEPTNAPQVQFTGLARYAWDMFGGTMAIQGDASYSDEAWYNIRNFDTHSFDDYWIYNAQLTWEDGNGNWLVSLIGRNLSDERAGIQGYDVSLICDCSEVSYRAPRWYGASIRYSF